MHLDAANAKLPGSTLKVNWLAQDQHRVLLICTGQLQCIQHKIDDLLILLFDDNQLERRILVSKREYPTFMVSRRADPSNVCACVFAMHMYRCT